MFKNLLLVMLFCSGALCCAMEDVKETKTGVKLAIKTGAMDYFLAYCEARNNLTIKGRTNIIGSRFFFTFKGVRCGDKIFDNPGFLFNICQSQADESSEMLKIILEQYSCFIGRVPKKYGNRFIKRVLEVFKDVDRSYTNKAFALALKKLEILFNCGAFRPLSDHKTARDILNVLDTIQIKDNDCLKCEAEQVVFKFKEKYNFAINAYNDLVCGKEVIQEKISPKIISTHTFKEVVTYNNLYKLF